MTTDTESNKNIVVNGDRLILRLPNNIQNIEELGIFNKLALFAFKENPSAIKICITYQGKELDSYRNDFELYEYILKEN